MVLQDWPFFQSSGKRFVRAAFVIMVSAVAFAVLALASGCSVNSATGKTQFTALMSPDEERAIGAREHPGILAALGGEVKDPALTARVRAVGGALAAAAFPGHGQVGEKGGQGACCQFFILDTPMVNAFAMPGGYVYVTRGLLALTSSEAELAAVLAHEIGHIAARHAAERYSHGAVSGIAAAVVAVAANAPGLADGAAGVGSDLYARSWSQAQEGEADDLGLKYLEAAGYDPVEMVAILDNIERFSRFEQGGAVAGSGYFSTHPRTQDRVAQIRKQAAMVGAKQKAGSEAGDTENNKSHAAWLATLEGLIWGQSAAQGFVRGREFFHPAGDFAFTAPEGFRLVNRADEVAILGPGSGGSVPGSSPGSGGVVAIFDAVADGTGAAPSAYLTGQWMKGEEIENLRDITISGHRAATASFAGTVDGRPAIIRLVAVSWAPGRIFRFQISIPENASPAMLEALRRMTYSLRPLGLADRARAQEWKLHAVVAREGDTVQSLSAAMGFMDRPSETFGVLNGLTSLSEPLRAGRSYKTVIESGSP